jgi:hypothetical protein
MLGGCALVAVFPKPVLDDTPDIFCMALVF